MYGTSTNIVLSNTKTRLLLQIHSLYNLLSFPIVSSHRFVLKALFSLLLRDIPRLRLDFLRLRPSLRRHCLCLRRLHSCLLWLRVDLHELYVPENLRPGKLDVRGHGEPGADSEPQDIFIPEQVKIKTVVGR